MLIQMGTLDTDRQDAQYRTSRGIAVKKKLCTEINVTRQNSGDKKKGEEIIVLTGQIEYAVAVLTKYSR